MTQPETPREAMLPLSRMVLYSAANLGTMMVVAFSNSALPLFLGRYQVPNILIGFLAQERSFVGGFVQPLVGALSDRLRTPWGRRRPFFLVGVPLTVASLVFLSTYPPLPAVLLLLLVFAFFLAVAYDPYLALMPDITPAEQRGRMGSAMALFNMLGQVSMLLLAAFLWEGSQPLVFYLVGVGLAASYGVTFFGIQEPSAPAEVLPFKAADPVSYVRGVLKHRELSKYIASQFFFWFGIGGATPFLTRFGVEVLGVSEGVSFLLFLVLVVATAVFAVPAGIAGDRLGKKRVLGWGLAGFGLAVLAGSQSHGLAQGAAVMVLVGAFNALTTVLAFPLLTDLIPKERAGELVGLGSLVWSLAQPLGATLAGLSVDLTGTYRSVFIFAGLMVLVSFLLLQMVRPERVARGEAP
ncbi:MAG: MFS transporter [Chloroflexota bacterium]